MNSINISDIVTNLLAQDVDFSKVEIPEFYFVKQTSHSAIENFEGFHLFRQ